MCKEHNRIDCPLWHKKVIIDENTYIPEWRTERVERNYGGCEGSPLDFLK